MKHKKATGFCLQGPARKGPSQEERAPLIIITLHQTVVQPHRSKQMFRILTSWPPCHTQQLLLAQEIRNQSRTHTRAVWLFSVNKRAMALPQSRGLCPFYYLSSFPVFYFSSNLHLPKGRWLSTWLSIHCYLSEFPLLHPTKLNFLSVSLHHTK